MSYFNTHCTMNDVIVDLYRGWLYKQSLIRIKDFQYSWGKDYEYFIIKYRVSSGIDY